MKEEAQAVIIGGGIVGCSIAYHLSLMGWKDVVLVPTHEVIKTLSEEALADGLARACRGDAQARARLNGDDTESPDAFGRLTHALGLDADVLRAGVLHAMRMGTHPVASETPAERRLR